MQQRPVLEIMQLREIAHGQESSRRASVLLVERKWFRVSGWADDWV